MIKTLFFGRTKKYRKDAKYFIGCYIEFLEVKADNEARVSTGRSISGMIQDFLGEIPRGSGYMPDTVSAVMDRLAPIPVDFLAAASMMSHLQEEQIAALCLVERYLGKRTMIDKREVFLPAQEDVFRLAGLPPVEYIEHYRTGIDKLNAELGRLLA
ncbi:MAG: hypothetical protein CME36_09610 [unclassified Hahellaceae]|nr:hypothetical protein [Hahellaceae bacterium]|tara:strand:+ start:25944 stop:26411 length:468 start_codon:yes stop_codon:yes gene_type:complete